MSECRKCETCAEKCGFVDGNWYILEVQGAKRPLLGQWDEKNDRFVGSGLVGKELDEAIPLKSGKVLWTCECPIRSQSVNGENRSECPVRKDDGVGVDLSQKGPITTYVSEDNIWNGLKDKKYWKTFIPREDVDDWRLK